VLLWCIEKGKNATGVEKFAFAQKLAFKTVFFGNFIKTNEWSAADGFEDSVVNACDGPLEFVSQISQMTMRIRLCCVEGPAAVLFCGQNVFDFDFSGHGLFGW
jgi:hypothetical protein